MSIGYLVVGIKIRIIRKKKVKQYLDGRTQNGNVTKDGVENTGKSDHIALYRNQKTRINAESSQIELYFHV